MFLTSPASPCLRSSDIITGQVSGVIFLQRLQAKNLILDKNQQLCYNQRGDFDRKQAASAKFHQNAGRTWTLLACEGVEDMLLERQRKIVDFIMREEYASVGGLSDVFHVSQSTIRNDLAQLQSKGLVERTHGGARQVNSRGLLGTYLAETYLEHSKQCAAEKRRIAQAAAKLVSPRSVIGIDGGTTTLELARSIAGRDITVVTNGIYSAMELARHRRTRVILIGGELNLELGCVTGRLAETMLGPAGLIPARPSDTPAGHALKVEQLFTSPGSLTFDGGLMDTDLDENYIKRLFISVADRVIVLADHTKIGHTALLSYAPLSVVDQVITDDQADPEYLRKLEELGISVTIAA